MMERKKGARSDVAASKRARMEAETTQDATSTQHDTTINTGRQMVHIADLLGVGAAHAAPLRDLVALTGWPERGVRRQIERERRAGALILSDNKNGYFLAADSVEAQRFARSMQHRAWEILRTVRAIEGAAGLD